MAHYDIDQLVTISIINLAIRSRELKGLKHVLQHDRLRIRVLSLGPFLQVLLLDVFVLETFMQFAKLVMGLLIQLGFIGFFLLRLLRRIQEFEKMTTRARLVWYLVTRQVFSGSIDTCFGQTRRALKQNFVLTFFKSIEVHQDDRVSELRLNYHLYSS